jgi:hypothetical protein
MGTLYYGDGRTPIAVDDEQLAHVRVVVISKLRRNEPFPLTWHRPETDSAHRSTVWVSSHSTLEFEFDEADTPELDMERLERLSRDASTARGLTVETAPSA